MVGRKLLAVAIMLAAALCATTARAEILIGVAGPMTGPMAWFGEQMERGAGLAVVHLNAAGGVLGQQVRLIMADDSCDPEQAVAAARKLVGDGVIFVVGHYCSGASIPASEIYQAAGVLQISPSSSNPMLTELGRANIFRVRERLPDLQFVVPDGVQGDDFPLIAGAAIEGVLVTSFPDARFKPAAQPLLTEFRAEGFEPSGSGGTLRAYAAVKVWTQAVEQAGSSDGKSGGGGSA